MNTRYSRDTCNRIDRALGQTRAKFLSISKEMSDEELLDVEERINATIKHYKDHVLEYVPFGLFLLRRTGEIFGANELVCKMVQLPQRLFQGGQLFYFQLISEVDVLAMVEVSPERRSCSKPWDAGLT